MRYAKITPPHSASQDPQPWIIGDDQTRGPGSRYILAMGPGFDQITQSTSYLGGSFTSNLALGNRDVTFTILVEHEFANENEAFLYVARLGIDCPGFGALELGTYGKGAARIYYASAVIRSVKPMDITNTSFRLQYEIAAGAPN